MVDDNDSDSNDSADDVPESVVATLLAMPLPESALVFDLKKSASQELALLHNGPS